MGSAHSTKAPLQKEAVFETKVYRIPALLYERDSKTLLAFAEQRRTSDDASGENLVMKTGKMKEESSGKRVEVIMPVSYFNTKLLVNCSAAFICFYLF